MFWNDTELSTQLPHFLAVCPWGKFFTYFSGFSLRICQMETLVVPTRPCSCCEEALGRLGYGDALSAQHDDWQVRNTQQKFGIRLCHVLM